MLSRVKVSSFRVTKRRILYSSRGRISHNYSSRCGGKSSTKWNRQTTTIWKSENQNIIYNNIIYSNLLILRARKENDVMG